MHSRQRKRLLLKLKGSKLANFEPLLQDIREKLGPDWEFYQEFLEGAVTAATREQDISAWVEQGEQLVKGREDVDYSHQGVLYLLQETRMKVKPRSEVPLHNDMPPPPVPQRTPAPPPVLQRIPALPSKHFSPPRTPVSKMQPRANNVEHTPLPYSDFNPYLPLTPASTTLQPQPISPHIALFAPPRINKKAPSPLQNRENPVFFTDPTFKQDVQNFFGNTYYSNDTYHDNDTSQQTTSYHDYNALILPYKANQDDLKVWKEGVGNDKGVENDYAKGEPEYGQRVA
ncbi:hypothetical protein BKA66DRAFT_574267 [Pyrenochaeta sp. MPI-SDFR-AT-0127]|nr:hypothetical protein BKA66DRAFT_574267 [Pyrenochaeta sp. MPI-SDFR-AT-0127]